MAVGLLECLEALAKPNGSDRGAAHRRMSVRRGDIHCEGDLVNDLSVLVDGMGYRYKQLPNGRRQIVGYLLPGDILSFGPLQNAALDCNIRLMLPSLLHIVHRTGIELQSCLLPIILNAAARDLSIAHEWVCNVGQRDAKARLAHLFCELYYRMADVGHLRDRSFPFPASQEEIADSVGITTVHANRTLQSLRRDELIAFDGRLLHVRDIAALADIAMFSPAYLHLGGARAAGQRRRSVETFCTH